MNLETAEILLRRNSALNPHPEDVEILYWLSREAYLHRHGMMPELDYLKVQELLARFLSGRSIPLSSEIEAVASILAAKEDEENERLL